MKGIRLADLMAGRCEARVEFGDETLTVGYRPYTDAQMEQAFAESGGIITNDGARRFLADVLLDWTLEGEDGEPLPRDFETLKGIPTDIVVPIFNAIRLQLNPPTPAATKSRKTSDAGSLAAAK